MGIRKFLSFLACLLVKEPFQLGNCCWKTPAKFGSPWMKTWEDGGIFLLIWGVHVQTISVFSLPPVA
jgi:hypothetical protein